MSGLSYYESGEHEARFAICDQSIVRSSSRLSLQHDEPATLLLDPAAEIDRLTNLECFAIANLALRRVRFHVLQIKYVRHDVIQRGIDNAAVYRVPIADMRLARRESAGALAVL